MIQKQIALLAVLIAAGLLIVSNLELGDEISTDHGVVIGESQSNAGAKASGDTSEVDAWELTDIRSSGSGFGFTDSTSFSSKPSPEIPPQDVSFSGGNATLSSTTPTSSSLFYGESTEDGAYLEADSKEASSLRKSEIVSLALPSATQTTSASIQRSQSQTRSSDQDEIKTSSITFQEQEVDSELEGEAAIQSDLQISGLVITNAGSPVTSMRVTLQLVDALAEDIKRFGSAEKSTESDTNGFYAFGTIVKGSYNVCTTEAQGYDRVCQKTRAPLNSADFRLLATSDGAVSGRVVDENGLALEGVEVNAIPNNKSRTTTNTNGEYQLPLSVRAQATYYLYLNKEKYARSRVRISGADVLAGKNKLADTVLTLISGIAVNGVVRDSSGSLVR
ncbi:MAG: hypothetical protein ACI9J2_001253 [Saprospiraceae bacterium]